MHSSLRLFTPSIHLGHPSPVHHTLGKVELKPIPLLPLLILLFCCTSSPCFLCSSLFLFLACWSPLISKIPPNTPLQQWCRTTNNHLRTHVGKQQHLILLEWATKATMTLGISSHLLSKVSERSKSTQGHVIVATWTVAPCTLVFLNLSHQRTVTLDSLMTELALNQL